MADLPFPKNMLEMYCVQAACGNRARDLMRTAPDHELLRYVEGITSWKTTPYSIIPGSRVVIKPEEEGRFFSRFSDEEDRTSGFRNFMGELDMALKAEKLRIYYNIRR